MRIPRWLKIPRRSKPKDPDVGDVEDSDNSPPQKKRLGKILKSSLNCAKILFRFGSGFTLLLISITGFLVIFGDPIPWVEPFFPIHIENIPWASTAVHLELTYVQGLLNTLHADTVVFGSAIGVLVLTLSLALVLLHTNPVTVIRRSPKAVFFHTPIGIYRRLVKWRNWTLEKIAYLNEESAKWKTIFNIMKSPYAVLRSFGLSPQLAATMLFGATAVGGGVVVNETILSERSFSRGDSGVYVAPADIPTEYVEGSNTLRIDLGNTPVREITIENVSVGTVFTGSALPSGEQNVVQISGNVVSGGTNTRLEIGHLIFEKSRCKKLELTDIQAHTLIVRGNASDGQSISPSPGTSRMLAIGGGHHQAEAMITSGGTYDRIWIQAPNSGVNGRIGTLRLTNLYTKGGICKLAKMNIGTAEILLNEIGMGNGFATKEFTIGTDVTAANITLEDNVEVTIAEPATT